MVSPQNPLKSTDGMASFEERMADAKALVNHPCIRVTDIETRLNTAYTSQSLTILSQCFPKTRFVWLMGADNLAQISQWQNWTRIFHQVPVAVFDRAPYSFDALAGKAAKAFDRFKVKRSNAFNLADATPPAWTFFHTRLHPESATRIRTDRAQLISSDSDAEPSPSAKRLSA